MNPNVVSVSSDTVNGSAGVLCYRTGSIQPGDQLLAIDNVRLDNCTLEDSARVLQDTHDIVKLTIKKDENFAGKVSLHICCVCHTRPIQLKNVKICILLPTMTSSRLRLVS